MTTDRQILERLQYAVMEPPDLGATWPSGLWTQAEILDYLNTRQARFIKATRVLIGVANTPCPAGTPRIDLPSDWIGTLDVVWRGQDGRVRNLIRSDSFEADHGDVLWETTRDTPWVYMDYDTPTLQLQIAPIPHVAGIVEVWYLAQAAPLDATGELLTVPDAFSSAACFYGALADMLGKDGRGKSPDRAAYCEARYQLGIDAAQIILSGWA